ncbi:MAG TPA: hypothetical protein VFY70_01445 [Thermomicrobiales bacterium]|nr:hypothetical protein [Thermomicrobiales bacterium]
MTTESVIAVEDGEAITCLLSEREAAIRGEELAAGLFAAVEGVAELPDGYGYRFSGDGAQLEPLLAFIEAERRCCPFLTFELAFAPHGGPIWLRLRGSPQVKAFIAEAFNSRVALDYR